MAAASGAGGSPQVQQEGQTASESVPKSAKKSAKVAKAKGSPKTKKAPAPSNHPTYNQMIKKALGELKEKKGTSKSAILKYIVSNFDVGASQTHVNAQLKQALKRGVLSGEFKQIKGKGASGSFKLGDGLAKAPMEDMHKATPSPKKPKASKPKKAPQKATKRASPKKSKAVKKSPAKAVAKPQTAIASPKPAPVSPKPVTKTVDEKPKPTKAPAKKAAPPKKASPRKGRVMTARKRC